MKHRNQQSPIVNRRAGPLTASPSPRTHCGPQGGVSSANPRGVQAGHNVNQTSKAVKQPGMGRVVSPMNSKAPNYMVQAPVHMAGRSQQIRATIGGTPQVAGSIEISPSGNGRVFISNLRVEQQHRRRGVAAKLIDAAVANARRQGFSAASLEARPSDNGISPQALVAMYRRQGFRNVGKTDRGSPLMERKL